MFSLSIVACGDQDSNDAASAGETESVLQAGTSCTPDPSYDRCYRANWGNLDYWQDTLPNPNWRQIQPTSHPDFDYEVNIYAPYLNAGVIPTQSGQGNYSSWSDYMNELRNLVGVDLSSYDVLVTIEGVSVKVDKNNDPVPYGTTPGSTSQFIHDALSDEDGKIYVDTQDVTAELLGSNQVMDYPINVSGQSQSDNSDGSSSNGPGVQSDWDIPPEDLEDDPWSAEFMVHGFEDVVPGISMIDYKIGQLHVDTESTVVCTWYFDPGDGTVEVQCPEADELEIEPAGYFAPHGWIWWDPIPKQDASELEVRKIHKGTATGACAWADALFYEGPPERQDDAFVTNLSNCPLEQH